MSHTKMLRVIITSTILLLSLLLARPPPADSTGSQFGRGGSGSSSDDDVYIVYMGAANPTNLAMKEAVLGSLLESGGRQEMDILNTYSHGLSGFAARLSAKEVESIAAQPGVVSVFPDSNLQLHTTRSWDFLQDLSGSNAVPPLPASSRPDSSNVVIGIFDSGIWPEAQSFRHEGTNLSVPRGWKGTCVTAADFNETACHGTKIVGARYYISDSPRDNDGHGSHVASTAAGAAVEKASFYDGLAAGTARGGSPPAKIAVYKVCDEDDCRSRILLHAFDDAIADCVHVISMSLGSRHLKEFLEDPQAIGAFHAVEHGITVVCSAGNSGPRPSTMSNDAPWIVTVAASTVDRDFRSDILLGGGKVVKGEWIGLPDLSRSPIYPLIDGRSAKAGNVSFRAARGCKPGSLDKKKTRGKLVICDIKDEGNDGKYINQVVEVAVKGGLGVIIANNESKRVAQYLWDVPITKVGSREAAQLMAYLKTNRKPLATILQTVVMGNYTPAPEVAFFSSRGPSSKAADIIKPDVTAPGVDILAASSLGQESPNKPKGRPKSSFNIASGTSMSCPHVSGVAANIKAANPAFSPSAIKSAIMTTAFSNNNLGSRITTHTGAEATPYDLGAGEVNPRGSLNPGLVYETEITHYLRFMCYYGYDTKTVRFISKTAQSSNFSCRPNSRSSLISNLNFPSISVLLRRPNQIRTVRRVLTNVAGNGNWTYSAVVELVPCVKVKVFPTRLVFTRNGERRSYRVKISTKDGYTTNQQVVYGWITWTNPHFKVRSPFVIRSN
ncbi:unnamed protein product [Linum tenue]|uniref:Uncharacterized protein n=1 Tax=Linum tenue TaxID=586396 RepID=A0AAV0HBX5_9ROSI|nr:unnamed protein product [Linum tenue]CAI0382825.1 unnamed protein product [Linum tenue]